MAHNLTQSHVLDDAANQDIEMQPTVADTIYLVVDTNILLGHIHILKNLVEDIASTRVPLVVICPGIVLNELDRQKTKSDRLGRRARSATDWMLREVTRKDLPQSIVKGQAQQETCKSTKNWKTRDETEALSNNDDLIIDCCQYFERKAATVLYTCDKNLCLRCNQEGLRFISPAPPYEYTHLDLVERMLGVLPEYDYYLNKMMQKHDHTIRENRKEDDGMMIDDDRPNFILIPPAIVHQQVIEKLPRKSPSLRALPEYDYHCDKTKQNHDYATRENRKKDDGMVIDDDRPNFISIPPVIVHQQVIEKFPRKSPSLRALPEYDYHCDKTKQNHDYATRENRKKDDGMVIDDDRPNFILIPPAIVHQQVIEQFPRKSPSLRALPEYDYHCDKMKQNHDYAIRKNKKEDNGIMIDDGGPILNQIPKPTIVHQQVIERFMPLLRALVKRVGGAVTEDLGKKASKYASKWQRKSTPVEEYTARDCLEYLQDKKHIVFVKPDPPLHRFLREPYSGQGALSGVEWAASAWRAAAASLRQIGETWEDDAMLEQVKLLDQYVASEYQYL